MNGNDSAMTWWHVFEKLSKYEQTHVSYDDVCAASGIAPKNILVAIAAAGFDANCDIANLLASHIHPRVVEASAKAALRNDGIEDRKLLLQHQGFIPVPKGTSINIGVSAQAQSLAAANANSNANSSVPSFLDDVDDLVGINKAVQGEIIDAQVKALPPASDISEADWHATLDALPMAAKVG